MLNKSFHQRRYSPISRSYMYKEEEEYPIDTNKYVYDIKYRYKDDEVPLNVDPFLYDYRPKRKSNGK